MSFKVIQEGIYDAATNVHRLNEKRGKHPGSHSATVYSTDNPSTLVMFVRCPQQTQCEQHAKARNMKLKH